MPDFDRFERLIRKVMVVEDEEVGHLIHKMEAIPRVNRPALFKDRSCVDMDQWVRRARQALASQFGTDAQFATTDVNREGSDLMVIGTDIEIELKTGKVTDANIGIGPMSWAFDDSPKGDLYNIMVISMRKRQDLARQNDWAGVRASQEGVMKCLFDYFCERLETDKDAPPRLAHYARAIACGITKEKDIVPLYGKIETEWKVPDILHAHWEHGWVPRANPFLPSEKIIVESVRNDGHGGKAGIPRAWVRLKGLSSERTADFYPHYKNRFHEIPAQFWVQTACFHVWIDKQRLS